MLADLTDAEFEELDTLLSQTPEPLTPLDVYMVDGYLCGVLVQPVLVEPAQWLPGIYDMDGAPLPDDVDAAWRERCEALLLRRHAALNRAIVEDGWFDPVVPELEEEAGAATDPAPPESDSTTLPPGSLDADGWRVPDADPLASLPPISRALAPWVAGFEEAQRRLPELNELDDDAVAFALARIYRHLPAEDDGQRDAVATLDRELPLTTLDNAIDDLVAAIVDLSELTEPMRFHVETVRREGPKVGRNDPCPCGSGKKFKQCHGAT